MRFTFNQLKEFLDTNLSPEELSHLLTNSGLEVEEYVQLIPDIDSLVILAQIVSLTKHPTADRLSLCTVDIGQQDPLQIVCGATNIYTGMKVPCAQVGAYLSAVNLKIKKSKIRQEESLGMLCSSEELGLLYWPDQQGIIDLTHCKEPLGTPLKDIFCHYRDYLYDINVTPNRGDCLSVYGCAREISFLDHTSSLKKIPDVKSQEKHTFTQLATIDVPESDCPAYIGCIIKNVNLQKSLPLDIRYRMSISGEQASLDIISLINAITHQYGQPMHAFDLDKIEGKVHVRYAIQGEKITLLNKEEIICSPDILLIADDKKPLAIAGIMGSLDSAVSEKTQHIFLESACFSPKVIAQKASQFKIKSQAAYRYERFVPPFLAKNSIVHAIHRIETYFGGESGPIVAYRDLSPSQQSTTVRLSRVNQILGVPVTQSLLIEILTRLNAFVTYDYDKEEALVQSPNYRSDLSIEEDYIEEVIRYLGYDTLPDTDKTCLTSRIIRRKDIDFFIMGLRRKLVYSGYQELLSLSFSSSEMHNIIFPEKKAIYVQNPISQHLDILRSDILCSLLTHLKTNILNGEERVFSFELGPVFEQKSDGTYLESPSLAILAYGNRHAHSWEKNELVDFFDVKGIVEKIFRGNLVFKRSIQGLLHPGRSADVYQNDQYIGFIGELHPQIYSALSIKGRHAPICASFNLNYIKHTRDKLRSSIYFSKHPVVLRDFSIIIDQNILAGEVVDFIKHLPKISNILQSVVIFDVFSGNMLKDTQKSIALRLFLQDNTQILADHQLQELFHYIIQETIKHFKCELRGTITDGEKK